MSTESGFGGWSPSKRTVLAGGVLTVLGFSAARAATSAELERDARAALQQLYGATPKARSLAAKSNAILVFPRIVKAGLVVGGQSGDGVLLQGDKVAGYYNISAGSFGLQAGVQSFAYALFFVSDSAVQHLRKSRGWAVGTGPSVVVLDQGLARTMNTTTLNKDVYAMAFGQKGLMAGAGLEGSKISPISPPA